VDKIKPKSLFIKAHQLIVKVSLLSFLCVNWIWECKYNEYDEKYIGKMKEEKINKQRKE